jgi:eukaryotic-like serine/threonine-protein kinase
MLQCPRCGRQFPNSVHVCPDDFTPLHADDTLADVPVDPLIWRVFDSKYELIERLGGGGMGTVYKARHLLIDRLVAIKILSQRFVGDETTQQRFRREARAAGRVQHPNAVSVTEFGATSDGYLYIVMEMLEGRTLRDLLAREGPLDAARAVSIMLQVCGAVGAGHDVQLIHRDLKPANIFIEQRPNVPVVVKVLDFGVAKFMVEDQDEDYQTLTQVGVIIGTPRYMSPEQCSGAGPLTPASDVYSLGIILYEMLTGSVPFSADTPLALALKQVTEAPQPPHEIIATIPEELERAVLQALAKNPADRPANANEFRRELHAVAEGLGLELADSTVSPTLDALRRVGTESPSGRLVIDLATLRQVQAATTAETDSHFGALGNEVPKKNQELEASAPRREFDRVKVELPPKKSAGVSSKARLALAVMIALIAILAAVSLTSRWWQSTVSTTSNQPANANVSSAASPTPEADASASPSPSPLPKREAKKAPKKEEKPGFMDKFKKKIRKIFRS